MLHCILNDESLRVMKKEKEGREGGICLDELGSSIFSLVNLQIISEIMMDYVLVSQEKEIIDSQEKDQTPNVVGRALAATGIYEQKNEKYKHPGIRNENGQDKKKQKKTEHQNLPETTERRTQKKNQPSHRHDETTHHTWISSYTSIIHQWLAAMPPLPVPAIPGVHSVGHNADKPNAL